MANDKLHKAKNEKMLAWLYDEDRWPSGAAGGLVTKDEKYRARCLLFTTEKDGEVTQNNDSRAEGGRTGLTSLVTSLCFAVCLFLSPVASIIPAAATAPALIFVGVLMLKNFSKVDMLDMRSAIPAFLTLLMMPLTYSIANGIGIGAISYTLITLFTGKYSKKDITVTIIALLFVIKFVFGTI